MEQVVLLTSADLLVLFLDPVKVIFITLNHTVHIKTSKIR